MSYIQSRIHQSRIPAPSMMPISLTVICVGWLLITGCETAETKALEISSLAGAMASGEMTSGEMIAGEMTAGERTAGEMTAGERTAGERTAGERTAGEMTAGERTAGERTAGEMTAGEMTAGDELPEEPIDGCVGPLVMSTAEQESAADNIQDCVTCVGALPPNFILRDLNPASCGVGQYYGVDAFLGDVTLVVLLRSSCGYCQAQLSKLEQIRFELLAEGHTLWISVINQTNTESNLQAFTMRSMSSILQDVEEVNAWEAMSDLIMVDSGDGTMIETRVGGDKDDIYLYNREGTLARFLDDDNRDFSLNLSTDEGYMNLKGAILEVLNGTDLP